MFIVMHAFYPGYTDGYIKSGLWRDGDGLRLMHKPSFGNGFDFNSVARKGTELRGFIDKTRCPLWVDRLLGGIEMTGRYEYDKSLIRELSDMLGDNFLGFQMHEWASNYHHDIGRIKKALDKGAALDGVFLEIFTADEWRTRALPDDLNGIVNGLRELYLYKKAEIGAPIVPVDSFALSHRIEIENVAKLILVEVGKQISDTRIQLAYARDLRGRRAYASASTTSAGTRRLNSPSLTAIIRLRTTGLRILGIKL